MDLHQDHCLKYSKDEEGTSCSGNCDLYTDCPMCQTNNFKLLGELTAVCEACGFRYSCCY